MSSYFNIHQYQPAFVEYGEGLVKGDPVDGPRCPRCAREASSCDCLAEMTHQHGEGLVKGDPVDGPRCPRCGHEQSACGCLSEVSQTHSMDYDCCHCQHRPCICADIIDSDPDSDDEPD